MAKDNFIEDKARFAHKFAELLQESRRFKTGLGYNGLLDFKYFVKENGDEIIRPIFEENPNRDDGYYDINVSGDSVLGMIDDIYKHFIHR